MQQEILSSLTYVWIMYSILANSIFYWCVSYTKCTYKRRRDLCCCYLFERSCNLRWREINILNPFSVGVHVLVHHLYIMPACCKHKSCSCLDCFILFSFGLFVCFWAKNSLDNFMVLSFRFRYLWNFVLIVPFCAFVRIFVEILWKCEYAMIKIRKINNSTWEKIYLYMLRKTIYLKFNADYIL